jgi:hypothetical protein
MQPSTPPKKVPPPRTGGLNLKPWPLPDFLISLLAVSILFMIERSLPKGTLPFPSVMGGAMAGVTMSYLSYCGYSIWTSPAKTKFALVLIFVSVAMFAGGVAEIFVGRNG